MNFIKPKELDSFLQLLLLFIYALVGTIICLAIAFAIIFGMYGKAFLNDFSLLATGDIKYLAGLKILQIASSIGFFAAPALFLALTERQKVTSFYGFKKPKLNLLLLLFLIMICSMPVLEFTAMANQKMVLPNFLKGLQAWMQEKEDEALKMTLILLKITNAWDFLVNLIMIAVLPAIAEELLFRGALQRIFGKIFKNTHVVIWFVAFIFSAIHVQFFGFLPRFFLGAMFGYLYFWSGSLWYAILGHFLNNAYAVCVDFYMQKNNLPLNNTDQTLPLPFYGYIISAILTLALFNYFKKTTKLNEQHLG